MGALSEHSNLASRTAGSLQERYLIGCVCAEYYIASGDIYEGALDQLLTYLLSDTVFL